VSQRNVERVLGRLATDEAFRRRFAADPGTVLQEMARCCGGELNECEVEALSALDPEALAAFAEALDPRIQKSDLKGDPS
jgi:hypothetical protein